MNSTQAMATFRDSVEAFGDAAQDQLARSGASYRLARSNMEKTYRERKAEIEKMVEAYGRRPWITEEHLAVRQVADHALSTLDAIYRATREALDTLHKG
ncbi:hypothetical protein [Rhizobium fabae]|uniref:Uncharacterized protein n=1 Tax=Rhizobium fabae TaxID=573179 RepID=A0A7W6FHG6_9HYPH|nr:hypothetical protein [Rhizobium fabae]MBB3913880.1 hypothetical protein [Rhizobium fabae]RUM16304.1 hypothetical protein EFB14_02995 [Rhizobium fabae]